MQSVWETNKYYNLARMASLDFNHPAMIRLKNMVRVAKSVLDLGCGEGTRLNTLLKGQSGKKGTGVDISSVAISEARKFYPKLKFLKGNLENLPFNSGTFDLVYSAFVLEHLDRPGKVINEAIRVLEPRGKLLLVAPNFGAPNRASPNYTGLRILKLIKGFVNDLLRIFIKRGKLEWNKAAPVAGIDLYESDFDTTIEPYLGSLFDFLKSKRDIVVDMVDSCWSEELEKVGPMQRFFRFLGEIGAYPFSLWGPHLIIIAHKKN